ncbi:MAG: hypothetical protein F4W92_00690 [Gammaproteobacteria bacterium]|nr:hypothetical protein [Gammaproteobacteria bacterium]
MHVKVREAGNLPSRAVYIAIGIDECSRKSVLGIWLGEHEGAKFWFTVLNELKVKGLKGTF